VPRILTRDKWTVVAALRRIQLGTSERRSRGLAVTLGSARIAADEDAWQFIVAADG
jgi:hypothetical protein